MSANPWAALLTLGGFFVVVTIWDWVRHGGFGCPHTYHVALGRGPRAYLCCRYCGRGLQVDTDPPKE